MNTYCEALAAAITKARRIYIIGNGGSHANSMHIANDLIACGVRVHTLDLATLTATANDYGYEQCFARWLRIMGEEGDVLMALSGSGKSLNILAAIEVAKEIGMSIWPIFGSERDEDMQRAEEAQLEIGHELMRILRKENSP